jgi:hypothetical protein
MSDCNACTPQDLNPVGTNCSGVPIRFTVRGRASGFVETGPIPLHFHVSYLKYGAVPGGYVVDYEPIQWSCTCPDFVLNLRRQSCCKHIIVCIDTILPGHSGTVYPYPNFLDEHVQPIMGTSLFRQMVPNRL